VGWWQVIVAWMCVAFDETMGSVVGTLGPKHVRVEACDPDIVARTPLPS